MRVDDCVFIRFESGSLAKTETSRPGVSRLQTVFGKQFCLLSAELFLKRREVFVLSSRVAKEILLCCFNSAVESHLQKKPGVRAQHIRQPSHSSLDAE
jgi:hypothetical protein